MHKSLRLKLTLMLMGIILGIVLCSTLISGLFLGDYYLYEKQRVLIETYEDVNRLYMLSGEASSGNNDSLFPNYKSNGSSGYSADLSEEFENSMERMSEGRSTSIIIFRVMGVKVGGIIPATPIYSSMGLGLDGNQRMIDDYTNGQGSSKTIRSTPEYDIKKIYVQRLNNDYLYLSATLDNGDNILIRSSMDSIERSVNLANQFFLYVCLLMLVAGTVIVYIISRNFTQPILDLAQIATHMSELDFTTKYQVSRQDEIGILGSSMNYLSSTLETTLGELKLANARLQKDLEKKTQIDNMRTEFLSNVSHELKTPIALIQGYAEGLMENINDDEESRNFYCEVIVDEAAKMNNIVKKLLDLNQLEFGDNNINMEHFDIVGVIRNMLSSSEILFKQKQVALDFCAQAPIYVWADVYMVEEVFNNYLSNAFNHVSGERRIKVDIVKDDQHVRVSVFNTGQPIPSDDLQKIWGKFYKVDKARTREYGGSGVGLSIVKASMELLGQRYGVKNQEDGVEFWFELDSTNGITDGIQSH
ncbi:MAG: HAMP domain-containing protein [Clostridiales bacterium]|nr:HAMP domain-containing protein [Clostridiales bacterium]